MSSWATRSFCSRSRPVPGSTELTGLTGLRGSCLRQLKKLLSLLAILSRAMGSSACDLNKKKHRIQTITGVAFPVPRPPAPGRPPERHARRDMDETRLEDTFQRRCPTQKYSGCSISEITDESSTQSVCKYEPRRHTGYRGICSSAA